MAIKDEMQVLVGDLEAATSRRTRDESERQAVAAADARDRMAIIAGMRIELAEALSQFRQERVMQTAQDAKARAEAQRERQSTAAQDARDRSAAGYERHGLGIQRHAADADDIRQRASDITGTLSEFHRERFMHAAQDARARAEAEHERQAIAAQDARARAAVAAELREIWSLHSAGLGSSR